MTDPETKKTYTSCEIVRVHEKNEREKLTVFGRVRRLGRCRDFARRRSVMTDLMQEVDGLTNQQNLKRRKKREKTKLNSSLEITAGRNDCAKRRLCVLLLLMCVSTG